MEKCVQGFIQEHGAWKVPRETCDGVCSGELQVHGRDWKRLALAVPNKTELQIKNYFQNYKTKVQLTTQPSSPPRPSPCMSKSV